MPTSPSPRRGAEARPAAVSANPNRSLWRFGILFVVLAIAAVAIAALPASLIAHFLPGGIEAQDFSGSLWHGSAGRMTLNARDAGALEWHLHPAALLGLALDADLHWVKGGFVLDGRLKADRDRLQASNITGGGPIADLKDLGVAPGWSGTAQIELKVLKAAFSGSALDVQAAVGEITVADVAVTQFASGANLGGYTLHFEDQAIAPHSDATAELTDTDGPLALQATIHYSPSEHRAILSGTVKERSDTPAALRAQLENLAELHARDAQGRIPIDLELTL